MRFGAQLTYLLYEWTHTTPSNVDPSTLYLNRKKSPITTFRMDVDAFMKIQSLVPTHVEFVLDHPSPHGRCSAQVHGCYRILALLPVSLRNLIQSSRSLSRTVMWEAEFWNEEWPDTHTPALIQMVSVQYTYSVWCWVSSFQPSFGWPWVLFLSLRHLPSRWLHWKASLPSLSRRIVKTRTMRRISTKSLLARVLLPSLWQSGKT